MARILLTAFIADIRNSVAGTTFSKGRYGNYVKSKGVPTKQNTSYQNVWRGAQSYISRSWKVLTEAERLTWTTNANNFPQIDKFGITFFLSGFSLYQQLNLNLSLFDSIPLLNCPGAEAVNAPQVTGVFVSWLAVANRYYVYITWTGGTNANREKQAFYATQPGSPGQMAVGKTTYFLTAQNAEEEAATLSDWIDEFFGVPGAGTKMFLNTKRINKFTGQTGVIGKDTIIFPARAVPVMGGQNGYNDGNFTIYANVYFDGVSAEVPAGYYLIVDYNINFSSAPPIPASSWLFGTTNVAQFSPTEDILSTVGLALTAGDWCQGRIRLFEGLGNSGPVQTVYFNFQNT